MSKQILAMFLLIYTTPFSLDSKMSSKILIKTAVFGTRLAAAIYLAFN